MNNQRREKWRVVQELNDLGAKFTSGVVCKCPFHDDTHASAGIYADDEGVWRFKCQVCDNAPMDLIDLQSLNTGRTTKEIVREMNPQTETTSQPTQPKKKPMLFDDIAALMKFYEDRGTVEAVYEYTNPESKAIDLIVVRHIPRGEERKRFAQAHIGAGSKVVLTQPAGKLPLFNRGRVAQCQNIIVVEGEKCVIELTKLELFKHRVAVTTAPMGAGKAHYADWSPLAGKKVYIWADNDDTGRKHSTQVAEIILRLNPKPEVYILDIDSLNLPQKGDAVNFIDSIEGSTEKTKAVLDLLQSASRSSGIEKFEERLNLILSGDWKTYPFFEFPTLSFMGRCLFPSSITCFMGDPGAGKSFFNLQTWAGWNMRGIPAACFMLECDKPYYLLRTLAQLAGNSNLTDTEWMKQNPHLTAEAFHNHAETLEKLSPNLWDSPDKMMRLDDLVDWVSDRVREGFEILTIDPITAADAGREPWDSEKKFCRQIRKCLEATGARLLLYTHPRLQESKKTLSNMAGSAAYPRFSDNVVHVIRHDGLMRADVYARQFGSGYLDFNRAFKFGKTRNGIGDGAYVAAEFRTDDLRLQELGIVKSKIEKLDKLSTSKLDAVEEAIPAKPQVRYSSKLF